jgi:hypothetical protein
MQLNTSYIVLSIFSLVLGSCEKETTEFTNYQTIELRQEFNNDWSRWHFSGDSLSGNFRTEFSNSWNRWVTINSNQISQIRTEFINSWNRWNYLTNGNIISIRTEFTESWNRWIISGSSLEHPLYLRTEFSDNNTRWVVSSTESVNMAELKTEFSNDYRRWVFRMKPDEFVFEMNEINAILFIAIFTASIYEQELVE